MLFCAFGPYWREKFRAIIYANHSRIAMVFRNPTEYNYHFRSWQIQIDFNRQSLIVKVTTTLNVWKRRAQTSSD